MKKTREKKLWNFDWMKSLNHMLAIFPSFFLSLNRFSRNYRLDNCFAMNYYWVFDAERKYKWQANALNFFLHLRLYGIGVQRTYAKMKHVKNEMTMSKWWEINGHLCKNEVNKYHARPTHKLHNGTDKKKNTAICEWIQRKLRAVHTCDESLVAKPNRNV